MYISRNGHIGSTHAYRMQQRQRQKDEVVKLGGKRKWLAKSDRKEPLPLPLNGSLPLTIIECTKCSPSARTRVQISAHFHFPFPFSCIFRARRKPEGRGLKCQLTKGTGVENLQEKNSPHIISHAWRHPHPIRIPKAIPIQTV